MSKTLTFLFVIHVLMFANTMVSAQQRNVTWQQSKTTAVTFGLRDKNNDLCADHNYSCSWPITAIVTGPDKKKYRLEKSVDGGEWCYFVFPDDFNAYPNASGIYMVDLIVKGKVVAQNGFRWSYPYEFVRFAKKINR